MNFGLLDITSSGGNGAARAVGSSPKADRTAELASFHSLVDGLMSALDVTDADVPVDTGLGHNASPEDAAAESAPVQLPLDTSMAASGAAAAVQSAFTAGWMAPPPVEAAESTEAAKGPAEKTGGEVGDERAQPADGESPPVELVPVPVNVLPVPVIDLSSDATLDAAGPQNVAPETVETPSLPVAPAPTAVPKPGDGDTGKPAERNLGPGPALPPEMQPEDPASKAIEPPMSSPDAHRFRRAVRPAFTNDIGKSAVGAAQPPVAALQADAASPAAEAPDAGIGVAEPVAALAVARERSAEATRSAAPGQPGPDAMADGQRANAAPGRASADLPVTNRPAPQDDNTRAPHVESASTPVKGASPTVGDAVPMHVTYVGAAPHVSLHAGPTLLVETAAGAGVWSARSLPDLTTSDIVQAIRLQAVGSGGEARIRLEPSHFGELTVSVRVEDGQVIARLQAESPVVREWLQTNQGWLRQQLAEHQLTLDRFEVVEAASESDETPERQTEERERHQDRSGRRARRDETGERFEVVA